MRAKECPNLIVSTARDSRPLFMKDLASPSVPLNQLASRSPHGFVLLCRFIFVSRLLLAQFFCASKQNSIRGEVLLNELAINEVPFIRATWFIKVVTLNSKLNAGPNQVCFSFPLLLSLLSNPEEPKRKKMTTDQFKQTNKQTINQPKGQENTLGRVDNNFPPLFDRSHKTTVSKDPEKASSGIINAIRRF